MIKVAVVYHSGYGHTEFQAQAICDGANSIAEVESYLIKVEEAQGKQDNLNEADAIVFGAPSYMGSVTAKFKEFMESTSKVWVDQAWKNKIAGGFSNSSALSGDKLNCLFQLMIFAGQHGMHWVNPAIMYSKDKPTGHPEAINRLGSWVGIMAQSEEKAEKPAPGDIETARLFGIRIAEVTKRWKR